MPNVESVLLGYQGKLQSLQSEIAAVQIRQTRVLAAIVIAIVPNPSFAC
jgi:hypothetical protein